MGILDKKLLRAVAAGKKSLQESGESSLLTVLRALRGFVVYCKYNLFFSTVLINFCN